MCMHVKPSNPGESDQILELSEMPTRNDPPSQSSRVSDTDQNYPSGTQSTSRGS